MAEVTVSELAKVVGAPVERLLKQMKEAGLGHKSESELVSDEDKQRLLSYLKSSHGESTAAPRKITLKRKTVSRLKTTSGQSRKTVNVEVRKKRTYIKREEESADVDAEAIEADDTLEPIAAEAVEAVEASEPVAAEAAPELDEEPVVEVSEPEPEPEPEVVAEPEPVEEEPVAEPVVEEAPAVEEAVVEEPEEEAPAEAVADETKKEKPAAPTEPMISKKMDFDPEALRQIAAAKRKKKEQEERERLLEMQRKKQEAEAERKRKAEEAVKKKTEEDTKKAAPRQHRLHELPASNPAAATDDDKPRRKGRGGKAKSPKKGKRSSEFADVDSDSSRRRGQFAKQNLGRVHKEHSKHGFAMPTDKIVHEVVLPEAIQVSELAQRMSVKAGQVIKTLMGLGVMATINDNVDQDTAILVVEEFGHKVVLQSEDAIEESLEETLSQEEGTLESRAPVVTVMGHVDHGKTSLLDYIRNSRVASGEAGGITQHIGAYHVETGHGMISFLDTPGHAAFTAMRARGATSTDIVILVVAADDGVMPQTEEAILHARAAEVPIVVAVNKIDKESADPDRVKNELAAKDVIPEDWGGDVQFVPVSAHTGEGVEALLDAVLLQSELLELKAARDVPAQGIVVESRLDKGRGPVASVLVQTGTLRTGDIMLAGTNVGRVRAMLDENGKPVKEAGPSIPVEILGLDGTPDAGDAFAVLESEKRARDVAMFREEKRRSERAEMQRAVKLDNPFAHLESAEKRTLNVVLKADVRGSLEALQSALLDLGNEEVQVKLVAGGVGGITESDVNLALTSGAVVFGFNVRAETSAKKLVEDEQLDLRYYSVIYNLIDDVKAALSGMLSPELREEIVGIAEVRDVFKSPKFGQVAGCMVTEGTVHRSKPIRVLRDNVVIFEGELESLRRFKDDVAEVRNGTECGIGVKNYDVKVGDLIEVFSVQEVARSL